jgi:iron(III) transport system ATP-binding protein
MSDVVISLRNISKTYPANGRGPGSEAAAVQSLSLDVRKGEILTLLGPSGCGKTTTLRLIAGLERPDRGEIVLGGRTVAGHSGWVPPEKRGIGLVFQDYALFPHMTVAKNIAFPLNGAPNREKADRVETMLKLVHLEGLGGRYPHELSGGQQQRVALARALAPSPALVLLDEPFSNLDADSRSAMRMHVRSVLKEIGATAVFVTHDQEEALFMGDRVAVMNRGRIEQVGTPEELWANPATRFVAEFLGLPCFLPALVTQFGLQTEIGLQVQPCPLPFGSHLDLLVRPDDLSVMPDPNGNGRVVRAIFRGMDYLYDVELPSGHVVQTLGRHNDAMPAGSRVRVELDPGHHLSCFPCKAGCGGDFPHMPCLVANNIARIREIAASSKL